MLQTRVGKRTGRAALRMAVEMTKQRGWKINPEEAVTRVTAEHLDQVLHPQFASSDLAVIATGLAASPAAAVGSAYFTADDATAAVERGERVILVRNETSPEDVHGMIVSEGILTAPWRLGPATPPWSPGVGQPAVCGARSGAHQGSFPSALVGSPSTRADVISIDGTTGKVVLGAIELMDAEPSAEFDTLLKWGRRHPQRQLAVRANADNGPDAANARSFGAEGIGLCRTEHMFLPRIGCRSCAA